jgi:hypothetical protein
MSAKTPNKRRMCGMYVMVSLKKDAIPDGGDTEALGSAGVTRKRYVAYAVTTIVTRTATRFVHQGVFAG